MADYREISQSYARAAVNTSVILNGGAAIALMNQMSSLIGSGFGPIIFWPITLWAAGAFLAGITYPVAFLSSRYVDKSEREPSKEAAHIKIADKLMLAGLISNVLSFLLFAAGTIKISYEFKALFG
ncbi:hypothetical protein ACI0FM_02945 [Paenochrobactrum sp. BZR 588]|uniref:hypothetical protein n=1 Tax=unclassified Paenochrobactrum TaxID=2639760 RepID=UPI0038521159